MRNLVVVMTLLIATAAHGVCTGDCSDDAQVTVDELTLGISIILGEEVVDACPPFDAEGDNDVTVVELVQAIDNALNGCREQIEQTLTSMEIIEFGTVASLQRGALPEPTGGPNLSTITEATVPAGITASVRLEADAPITTVYLGVGEAQGYYVLTLDEPTTEVTVDVTFAGDPPRDNFDCLFSAGDSEGRIGDSFTTTITIANE